MKALRDFILHDVCVHGANSPCPDAVHCISHNPMCKADAPDMTESITNWRRQVTREQVERPTLFVGTGTCGLGAGAAATLQSVGDYLARNSIDAELVEVGCIGLCSVEPLLDVQLPGRSRLSFKEATGDKVDSLLDSVFKDEINAEEALFQFDGETVKPWPGVSTMGNHPFFGAQKRFVLENCGKISPASLEEYLAGGGYLAFASALKTKTPEELCSMVTGSGLRGRGGGGFPTGQKWSFAAGTEADQKYMICNADEGDPGAFMDRAIIEGDPHRLLEGLALAAYGIGATKAYVYIRAEYPLAIERLNTAIDQAKTMGLIGENILDSGFDLEINLKVGAGAFVCGEETALIHSIEGKRGMPRPRPPFPAVSGLFGKPTIINNVETLSNLPGIVGDDGKTFAQLGTGSSRGTKVFALSGKVVNTGLVEVEMGERIGTIVKEIGGGIPDGEEFKAVQIGGPSGGCLTKDHLDTPVDYESLKTVGAMMGSGGLVVMDQKTCMVDVAKFFMDFIQRESCGKCIPCREGTKVMLKILEGVPKGRRAMKGTAGLERFKGITELERLAGVISKTSLCGLGQTAPNPVLSTLRWFRDEYEAHVYERCCPAGSCTELLEYTIDPEKCTGCMACAKKCPVDAIHGVKKAPHYIVESDCTGCGVCLQVCKKDAVIAV